MAPIELMPMGPDDEVRWRFVGELDVAGAEMLEARVLPGADAGRHILLDLSRVEFVDGRGLGRLLALHRRAIERGGGLRLIASPALERVAALCDLDGWLRQVSGGAEEAPAATPSSLPPDWEWNAAITIADTLEDAVWTALGASPEGPGSGPVTSEQWQHVMRRLREVLAVAETRTPAEAAPAEAAPAESGSMEDLRQRLVELRAESAELGRRHRRALAEAAVATAALRLTRSRRVHPL